MDGGRGGMPPRGGGFRGRGGPPGQFRGRGGFDGRGRGGMGMRGRGGPMGGPMRGQGPFRGGPPRSAFTQPQGPGPHPVPTIESRPPPPRLGPLMGGMGFGPRGPRGPPPFRGRGGPRGRGDFRGGNRGPPGMRGPPPQRGPHMGPPGPPVGPPMGPPLGPPPYQGGPPHQGGYKRPGPPAQHNTGMSPQQGGPPKRGSPENLPTQQTLHRFISSMKPMQSAIAKSKGYDLEGLATDFEQMCRKMTGVQGLVPPNQKFQFDDLEQAKELWSKVNENLKNLTKEVQESCKAKSKADGDLRKEEDEKLIRRVTLLTRSVETSLRIDSNGMTNKAQESLLRQDVFWAEVSKLYTIKLLPCDFVLQPNVRPMECVGYKRKIVSKPCCPMPERHKIALRRIDDYPLSQKQASDIIEKIESEMDVEHCSYPYLEESGLLPEFHCTKFTDKGFILLHCGNSSTFSWLSVVDSFALTGYDLELMDPFDADKCVKNVKISTMLIIDHIIQDKEILKKIKSDNKDKNINFNKWQMAQSTNTRTGLLITFLVDAPSLIQLMNKNLMLKFDNETLVFNFGTTVYHTSI